MISLTYQPLISCSSKYCLIKIDVIPSFVASFKVAQLQEKRGGLIHEVFYILLYISGIVYAMISKIGTEKDLINHFYCLLYGNKCTMQDQYIQENVLVGLQKLPNEILDFSEMKTNGLL